MEEIIISDNQAITTSKRPPATAEATESGVKIIPRSEKLLTRILGTRIAGIFSGEPQVEGLQKDSPPEVIDLSVRRGVAELRKELQSGATEKQERDKRIERIVETRFPGDDYTAKAARACFTAWAPKYDEHMKYHEDAIRYLVQKATVLHEMARYPVLGERELRSQQGRRQILEMTCGTGAVIDLLCRALPESEARKTAFVANDITPEMREKISARMERLSKKRRPLEIKPDDQDIRSMEYEPGQFDAAILSQTLHLIPDPKLMEFEKYGDFSRGEEDHKHIKTEVIKRAFDALAVNGHFIMIDEWKPKLSVIPEGMGPEVTDLFGRIFRPIERAKFRESVMTKIEGARLVFEGKTRIDGEHDMFMFVYRRDQDKISCRGRYTTSETGNTKLAYLRHKAMNRVIGTLSVTDRIYVESFPKNGNVGFRHFDPDRCLLIVSGEGPVNRDDVLRVGSGNRIKGKYDSVVFRGVLHDIGKERFSSFLGEVMESLNVGGTMLFVDAWGRESNMGYLSRRKLRDTLENDFERQMMFEATLREPIAEGYDDGIYGFMYKKVSK